MSVPATRNDFKEYCLRKLGKPVIEINVDDDQVEDRIDESLKYYWDYHFDGSEKIYYKHQITQQNITDRYITMPDNILGVVNIFEIGQALNTNNLFNIGDFETYRTILLKTSFKIYIFNAHSSVQPILTRII